MREGHFGMVNKNRKHSSDLVFMAQNMRPEVTATNSSRSHSMFYFEQLTERRSKANQRLLTAATRSQSRGKTKLNRSFRLHRENRWLMLCLLSENIRPRESLTGNAWQLIGVHFHSTVEWLIAACIFSPTRPARGMSSLAFFKKGPNQALIRVRALIRFE